MGPIPVSYLSDNFLRPASRAIRAEAPNIGSADEHFTAQVLGWLLSGQIARTGSIRRFAAGYRSADPAARSVGVPIPLSTFHRYYGVAARAARHMGEWAPLPEDLQDPEPPAPIAPALPEPPAPIAPALPEPPAPEPAPKAKKARKEKPAPEEAPADDLRALWDRMQEAYKSHAPAVWPRLSRRLTLAPGTRSKLVDAVAVAGGADQLLATVELALHNVPSFYRTTYLENGRGAPDCLSLLLQGNAATRHLGVDGWGVFNWTDRVDRPSTPSPSATPSADAEDHAPFDRGYLYGANVKTPEQRRAAREWLYQRQLGPHPDAGAAVNSLWFRGYQKEIPCGEWFPCIPPASWIREHNGGVVPAWVRKEGKPWKPTREDVADGVLDPPAIFAEGPCFVPF